MGSVYLSHIEIITGGCELRVNGDLGQPQPVYIHRGSFIEPTGNTGLIHLEAGEQVVIACTGAGRIIVHPNIATTASVAVSFIENVYVEKVYPPTWFF